MRIAFAPLEWAARYWPWLFFRAMKAAVSKPDRAMLDIEAFERSFRLMEREAFRQGSRRAAHEATLCFGDWDFDIAEVTVPTYIWLGGEYIFVSDAMGPHLKDTIPGAVLHLVAQRGHFNIENWHDIFEARAKEIP